MIRDTHLEATIPANLFGRAGSFPLVVKNPKPLAAPVWGEASNRAYILVPFEYTKILAQPQW